MREIKTSKGEDDRSNHDCWCLKRENNRCKTLEFLNKSQNVLVDEPMTKQAVKLNRQCLKYLSHRLL